MSIVGFAIICSKLFFFLQCLFEMHTCGGGGGVGNVLFTFTLYGLFLNQRKCGPQQKSCWTTSLKGQLLTNKPPAIITLYYYQTVPTAKGSHYTFQTKSVGNNCLSPLPPMPSRKWLNPKISYRLLTGGRNLWREHPPCHSGSNTQVQELPAAAFAYSEFS